MGGYDIPRVNVNVKRREVVKVVVYWKQKAVIYIRVK